MILLPKKYGARTARLLPAVAFLGLAGGALGACGKAEPRYLYGGDDPPVPSSSSEVPLPPTGIYEADPPTCEAAAASKSYVGCDYFPTVTANVVASIFDYAVVVANHQPVAVEVTVTGGAGSPGGEIAPRKVTVPAGGTEKIFLPWVRPLKIWDEPPEKVACAEYTPRAESVLARNGAYRLQASAPVVVYQFNPIEYSSKGGPAGKDWSTCPGLKSCQRDPNKPFQIGCLSFTNDASLLLPATALTGTVRLNTPPIWEELGNPLLAPFVSLVATTDGTEVAVATPSAPLPVAGATTESLSGSGPNRFLTRATLNAGDVLQLSANRTLGERFSGGLVTANHPIQVLSGIPCSNVPVGVAAGYCDHLEEALPPAESLGQSYVVSPSTGPAGTANKDGDLLQFVGNRDGTALTYDPARPAGCPESLNAGEVRSCRGGPGFEIRGTHEFSVATFLLGSTANDVSSALGDPSQTAPVPVEQFRKSYTFLALRDFPVNYADVVFPRGATVYLDGAIVTDRDALSKPIGALYDVRRLRLSAATEAHTLSADRPIGVSLLGYGEATSYAYPAGLNLTAIASAPER